MTLDIRMKDEGTSWQQWYEENPRPRKKAEDKLTYGVGVNDLPYVTRIVDKTVKPWVIVYKCQYHAAWERMLRRCYQQQFQKHYPTYRGVEVCGHFKRASNFRAWMETQVTYESGEILQLDKDILFPGNKVYSPGTCVFVPSWLNKTLGCSDAIRGELPIGVRRRTLKDGSSRFYSVLHLGDNQGLNLGTYSTAQLAHKAWQVARSENLIKVIRRYRDCKCYRQDVDKALMFRVDNLLEDVANSSQTLFLI